MPPEVIAKRVFTSASDVWSFGITLWEMFSFGQQPWADFSSKQVSRGWGGGRGGGRMGVGVGVGVACSGMVWFPGFMFPCS